MYSKRRSRKHKHNRRKNPQFPWWKIWSRRLMNTLLTLSSFVLVFQLMGVWQKIDEKSGGQLSHYWHQIEQQASLLGYLGDFFSYLEDIPGFVSPPPSLNLSDLEQLALPAHATSDPNLIHHRYYSLLYNEAHEQAAWVAYHLSPAETNGEYERLDNFREDPAVPRTSASLADYRSSGYDRGHLAPAADFRFSERAMSESFFMSNMSPQIHAFNAGNWRELEQKVRKWAQEKGGLCIVTGPILHARLEKIGENRVSVPRQFFKVLLAPEGAKKSAIAFLMPNRESYSPIQRYMISIDDLEALTGLDFFPRLEDPLENQLEESIRAQDWF